MNRRSPFRRVVASAVVVVVVFGLGACGDDDDAAAGDEETTTTTRPTTTEPPDDAARTESSELTRQAQDLLTAYDQVLARIARDPSAASDRAHPLYSDLRALLTPESAMADPVINGLVAAGSRGERQLPNSGSHLPVERRIEGEVQEVSANELRAYVCGYMNYGVFNSRDQQIQLAEQHVEPSQVTIIREGSELRIERFDGVEEDRCMEAPR